MAYQDDDEAEEADDSQQRSVDNYTGVAIKVRTVTSVMPSVS